MCGPCFLIGTPGTALDLTPMKLDALKRLQAATAANKKGQTASDLAALLLALLDRAFKGEL